MCILILLFHAKIPKPLLISFFMTSSKYTGVFIISETKRVIDIVKIMDSSIVHKQIEERNGMIFMRLKKRRMLAA